MAGEEESFDAEEFSEKRKSSSNLKLKLETIIPIIVIIGVILLIVFKTNVLSGGIPLFEGKGAAVLVIGSPSPEFTRVLNDAENKDVIRSLRTVTIDSIQHNPKDMIKNYDIIILDQSLSSDKSITRTVGEAIKSYVQSGGKFILVLNSGIERPGDASVIGWTATFGDIIPVKCDPTLYSVPSCKNQLNMNGIIYATRSDSKNAGYKIMYGIDRVPALEAAGLIQTVTFDVSPTGTEIAYLQDARSGKVVPAIVEQPLLLGKVIYFNYNPGLSEAIFVNTIKYLK